MAKAKKNGERERRITEGILVDAYGSQEQVMGMSTRDVRGDTMGEETEPCDSFVASETDRRGGRGYERSGRGLALLDRPGVHAVRIMGLRERPFVAHPVLAYFRVPWGLCPPPPDIFRFGPIA